MLYNLFVIRKRLFDENLALSSWRIGSLIFATYLRAAQLIAKGLPTVAIQVLIRCLAAQCRRLPGLRRLERWSLCRGNDTPHQLYVDGFGKVRVVGE